MYTSRKAEKKKSIIPVATPAISCFLTIPSFYKGLL